MTQPVLMPAGHEVIVGDMDAYENLTGVWQAYTPVWSSTGVAPVLNNGSLVGSYFQAGKLVHVRIVLTPGSTTTFGNGNYRLSLPVAPKLDSLLAAYLDDASAALRWAGQARIIAATTGGDNMRIVVAPSTGGVTEAAPFVWANGDKLILHGSYEAA